MINKRMNWTEFNFNYEFSPSPIPIPLYQQIFLIHFMTYWMCTTITGIIDWFYLDKMHVNWSRYHRAIICSGLNQLLITLPVLYVLDNHINNSIVSIDKWNIYFVNLFLLINLSNGFFYFTHRLLHVGWLFRMIHYKHHEFTEPIGCATLYAHPIEHLFANVLSFVVPILMVGATSNTILFIAFGGTLISIQAHINYPIFPSVNRHLIHHKYFKCNYGFGGYLDKIFHTFR
jgi:sterol desaturase/sphingolipid hydroxylase (fatty acid hydroxylase superfamily)